MGGSKKYRGTTTVPFEYYLKSELRSRVHEDESTLVAFTKHPALCPFNMEFFKNQEEQLSHLLSLIAYRILSDLKLQNEWETVRDPLDKCSIKNIYAFDKHPPNGLQEENLEQNIMLKVTFGIRKINKKRSIFKKLQGKDE